MSEDSDQDIMPRRSRRLKRQATRSTEDAGDSSDSSSEPSRTTAKVAKTVKHKPVPRVMSDVHDGIDKSSDLEQKDVAEEKICSDGGEKEQEQGEMTSEVVSNYTSEEREISSSSDPEASQQIEVALEELPTLTPEAGASSSADIHESNTSADEASTEADTANCVSESKDGEVEKCPICLLNFATQEIGTPDACNHNFCLCCLQEWVKNTNACPVDRQIFNTILVRSHLEGEVINKIPVKSTVQANDHDAILCVVCRGHENTESMVFCYECSLFYHPECVNPPLDLQDRFGLCPNCQEFTLHNPEDEARCWVCWTLERPPEMVMCFECSTNFHVECLDPPVNGEPARWLCPRCNKNAIRHFPWQLPA